MMPGWRTLWMALWQRVSASRREPRAMHLARILVLGQMAVYLSLLFRSPDVHALGSLLFALVLGALLLALLLGGTLSWVLYAAATLSMGYMGAVSFTEGGIYSASLAWLPLIPLAVFYVAGARAGRLWMVPAILLPLGLVALKGWGFASWSPVGELSPSGVSYVNYLLVSVALFLVLDVDQKNFEHDLDEGLARQRELQVRQREMEHTAQWREHFITMVSHELRTPMNAILGLNTVLLERVQDRPQAMRVLEYTRQSADHLMTVINDVLDHPRPSAGQCNARVERFALHETVRAAFELFLPQIENTRLRYECDIGVHVPWWVQTDRHRLMQVLVNLLGNAVKFTHQGHVRLSVQVQGGGVVFEVQDSGIGIAPERQQAIFERFRQAEASIQQRYGGSGLGLTISQRLVQMLGGQVGLESHEGSGSRFWFWLPLQAVDAPQPEVPVDTHTAPAQAPRVLRFLVVDDHPVNRLLAHHALMRQWPGSQVQECDNGAKALLALEDTGPCDLVLMDMVMPVMDGIEATQRIRQSAQARVRDTPVLGLTAHVSAHDLVRFEQAGLNGLLLKPFDLGQLRAEVTRLVGVSARA